MALPARRVNLHHSVTPVTRDPYADMRTIERVGIQRFGIYSYSYALHPDLDVAMEGCGLHVGAHTAGFNSTEFGVVLIGNYDNLDITDKQVTAFARLIEHLSDAGAMYGRWTLRGHRDTKATACPGGKAYPRLGELHRAATNPAKPPPTGDLTMSDIKVITDALNRTNKKLDQLIARTENVAKLPVALHNPVDNKVWIVSGGGRWHVPSRPTLDKLIIHGQVANVNAGYVDADPGFLAEIPITDAPAGLDGQA